MSADELRATGLGKLSAAEMSALNGWLQRYTHAVFLVATGQTGSSPATQAAIESRIDGEFNGWEGETIFKLVNGQIWQQSTYAYKYVYKYGPKVLIYKSGAGYKMQVEGVDGTISVTRLK